MNPREYVYDVTKIEVLDDMPNTSNGAGKADKRSLSACKITERCWKTQQKKKKLLDKSEELTDVDKYSIEKDERDFVISIIIFIFAPSSDR